MTSDHRHRRDSRQVRSDDRAELRQGTPYEEILNYVEEQDIGLVVMGTHGRPEVEPDLGSTTLRGHKDRYRPSEIRLSPIPWRTSRDG